ncbi:hypothetical protein RN001_007712 [Aquatica leii]|uniref:Uncharacterized protein n=1 Tax=Aquatica leii TaxID=1421715 RepID=A0AAN7PC42_9COLE|nr:hypothetical protein RN001_007712 [Aquatica leii]
MEAHIKSHSENGSSASPTSLIPSESSCSSSSDKENKDSPVDIVTNISEPAVSYDSDIRYYLYSKDRGRLSPPTFSYIQHSSGYPSSGVELLAAAATATERAQSAPDVVLNLISKNSPDVVATLRHPAYFSAPTLHYDTPLTAGDNIRRQVEACLAVEEIASEDEPSLTPPSSNPVSPAPSLSPDPELSLPPRKRSRMILKSMETIFTEDSSPVRYSSVIQYARAS